MVIHTRLGEMCLFPMGGLARPLLSHISNAIKRSAGANKRLLEYQEIRRGWKIIEGKQMEKQNNEKELTNQTAKTVLKPHSVLI
jgi:hypothetical protein